MILLAPAVPPPAGPLDDGVRLIIVVAGLLVCGVCLNVGWRAVRRRDWEQGSAVLSYALFVVAPASSSLLRFGQPLTWIFAILYLLGLLFSFVALSFRVKFSRPEWFPEKWTHRRG